MLGTVPLVHMWPVMALKAKVPARFRENVAMWVVTGRTVKCLCVLHRMLRQTGRWNTDRRADLMGMDGILKPLHGVVTTVAGVRCHSAEVIGRTSRILVGL